MARQRQRQGVHPGAVGGQQHEPRSTLRTKVSLVPEKRSSAQLSIQLDASQNTLPLTDLIDTVEAALGTAVQTAVKRADEQAFALANGQNLMFCEDAARRLNLALKRSDAVKAFHLKVIHAESLHAHDAVAESRWTRDSA